MNKDQMAHEMAMAMQSQEPITDMKLLAVLVYQYADAMQAEADKRQDGATEAILKALNSMELEWQPDWDKIPDGFDWWAMDKKGKAHCFDREPVIDSPEWVMVGSNGNYQSSLTFNYQDDWRDSLRKRPEMEAERNG